MSNIQKLLLFCTLVFFSVIIVEVGYLAYLKRTNGLFSSLSTVTLEKDYDAWFKKNSVITSSRLVNPDSNTRLIINQTKGVLKSLLINSDKITTTIQTKEGTVDFTFPHKDFQTYRKPANSKEVLIPIESGLLKTGDYVVIHESYAVVGDKIKNTNNGIVKME